MGNDHQQQSIRRCIPSLLGIVCISSLLFGIANTAQAESRALEEITVTAQKREQPIEDVGISITAFTGTQLKELGFQDSRDIASMTPGVFLSGNDGGEKTLFTIRGVTQSDFSEQTEAPVAVYVDGGYVAFGQGQLFGLFDLKRVEVDKGPQGTLFGRNATGGLIQFISNKPTREKEGYADVTYGSYNQARFEGAISGPLTDTLSARAAVLYDRFDPILKNDYPNRAVTLNGKPLPFGGKDTFNGNTLGFRGEALYEPNDNVNFLVIGAYARTRKGSAPFLEQPTVPVFDTNGNHVDTIVAGPTETRQAILPDGTPIHHPYGPPGLVRPAGGNLFGPSCTQKNYDNLKCSQDFALSSTQNKTDTWSLTGKLTWKLSDSITLTSLSDYKNYRKTETIDADGGPVSTLAVLNPSDADAQTFSQELRLNGNGDRFRWVAGAYYLYIDLNTKAALEAYQGSLFVPLVGVPFEDAELSKLKTNSFSVFGQLEFDITDRLTFIGGLRTIRELKDFTHQETIFESFNPAKLDTNVPLFTPQPRASFKLNRTLWSGKVQLNWHPVDHLLLYAGINRGVKAGGFNTPFTFGAGFPKSQIPYGAETLLDYEGGFKWDRLFGGTTRINGSFYYYDYRNYQGFFFNHSSGTVVNVNGKYKGAELELFTSPTDSIDLALNASYIDAKLYGIQLGPGIFVNTEPTFTPDFQTAGLVRYHLSQPVFGGRVDVQASFNYASKFWGDIRNFQADRVPAYVVGNFRLDWTSADSKWEGSFFVHNIADERYFTISYDLSDISGSNSLVPGKPRWFGAELRYKFF